MSCDPMRLHEPVMQSNVPNGSICQLLVALEAATLSEGNRIRKSAASTAQAEPLIVESIQLSDELSHVIEFGLDNREVVVGVQVAILKQPGPGLFRTRAPGPPGASGGPPREPSCLGSPRSGRGQVATPACP